MSTVEVREEDLSRKRRETRERLVEAAFRVFARDGVGASALDAITKEAGYTRGAFYSNFDSKDALLAALARRENERRLRQLSEGREALRTAPLPPADSDPAVVVNAVLLEFLSRQKEDRTWLIIEQEIRLLGMRDSGFGAYLAEHRAKILAELREIMSEILDRAGLTLTISIESATHIVLATRVESTVNSVIDTSEDAPERRALEEFLTSVVRRA